MINKLNPVAIAMFLFAIFYVCSFYFNKVKLFTLGVVLGLIMILFMDLFKK